ncbi:MAG TPA: DUF4097 family beta strand repeat-containing protein [Pyrinomonadaceae bacterium]|nr:DUF4097 family beta strand repeat-containing protein [Pyrinomonadaceae bacterium]
MRSLLFRLSAVVALLLVVSASEVSAQDYQKSYRLNAGETVSVRNVSGDVNITGYEGDSVSISAFKEGRDRAQVEIVDESGAGGVNLSVKYPRECNCDASVRFELRVPRGVRLNFDKVMTASGNIQLKGVTGQVKVATASGDVTVEDVAGEINASTASGNMSVRNVSGTVSAQSASGDVRVEIARLEGEGDMKFATASGNVDVRLPASLDAHVKLSTVSGTVKTNFPLEVKERQHGPGSSAEGQLGSGARKLRISSASGDVSLNSQ